MYLFHLQRKAKIPSVQASLLEVGLAIVAVEFDRAMEHFVVEAVASVAAR